jgi:hypothetical protein
MGIIAAFLTPKVALRIAAGGAVAISAVFAAKAFL